MIPFDNLHLALVAALIVESIALLRYIGENWKMRELLAGADEALEFAITENAKILAVIGAIQRQLSEDATVKIQTKLGRN